MAAADDARSDVDRAEAPPEQAEAVHPFGGERSLDRVARHADRVAHKVKGLLRSGD